jgi:hypothetical protein
MTPHDAIAIGTLTNGGQSTIVQQLNQTRSYQWRRSSDLGLKSVLATWIGQFPRLSPFSAVGGV